MPSLNQLRDKSKKSTTIKTLDSENTRFCNKCHLQLVPRIGESDIYVCPQCNCTVTRTNSYPNTKLRVTFPTHDPTAPTSQKAKIMQSEDQKLPRSQLYFKRRQQEKNAIENQDPYLAMLKQNNQIRLTNVEYYSYYDNDYYYYNDNNER